MNNTSEEIMREAEILIEQAQRSLAATAEIYQAHGLNQDKLAADISEQQRAEAQALFRRDLEDVERDVEQEAVRLSFANAAPQAGVPPKLRNMV